MILHRRLRRFGGPPRPPGVYRDDAVMEDAGARLEALGLFSEVFIGAVPDEQPAAASDGFAVAWVWDARAENREIFPGTSTLLERKGFFGVAIEVRDQNPTERRRRMARLENEILNALQGKSLANACYTSSVRFGEWGRDYAINHPHMRMTLIGEYRFPIGGNTAANTDDRESVW